MDDVGRQDRKLFWEEVLKPGRIVLSLLGLLAIGFLFASPFDRMGGPGLVIAAFIAVPMAHALTSYRASVDRRFIHKRYLALWNGVQDRLKLFDEVLARMRKDQIADLQELPRNIHRVASALYVALRRADMISHEVALTEKGLYAQPPSFSAPAQDAQAKELYRIADKNIAEYRSHFAAVTAGVQRTEAQSAVLTTTVDTLRMKMIGYRLVGRSPELSSKEFLEAMQEAKMQLAAIDQALDELELTPFPKTIAVMPSELPEDVQEVLKQGD